MDNNFGVSHPTNIWDVDGDRSSNLSELYNRKEKFNNVVGGKIMSNYYYDVDLGLFDHGNEGLSSERPYAIVAKHEQENWFGHSPLQDELLGMLEMDLPKITGMSIMELLDLPSCVYDSIKNAAMFASMKNNKSLTELEESIKKMDR